MYPLLSAGFASLTEYDGQPDVVVWRVNPERVGYGHFYFSISEAILRIGNGSGFVHNRSFPSPHVRSLS